MDAITRLRLLRDGLTTDGTVTFTRNSLSELLGETPAGDVQHATQCADLTVEQIAERFGRSPGTVRDWIRAKKLRAYPFSGKEYRVTPAALEEFIQAQREGKQEPAKRQGKPVDLGGWRRVRDKAA